MLTVTQALQEAVNDYQQWAEKPYINAPSYQGAELRGIFFNKLLSRLREVESFNSIDSYYPHTRVLEVIDIITTFERFKLISLEFVKYHYGNAIKREWMANLSEAAKMVVFDLLPDKHYWALESVIKQIKAY